MEQEDRNDAQELAEVAAASDLSKWPALMLKLDLGQITADEVMAAAANASDVRNWHVCEANFYAGEDALLHHQRAMGLTHLKAARDGCPKSANDYALAVAELKRLGVTTASAR